MEDIKVYYEKKDLTLSDIKEKFEDGDIIPNPDYQRDYVYDDKKASLLVESILLGIPIPTIYLCEEDDNTYTVIDGQQRLTSFVRFMRNEFVLKGLKTLSEYNKKAYKDLPKEIQRKIKGTTLPVITINKESKEVKYDIFARLNQGAVKLKPQELRNCIYRGPFNELLNELAKNKLVEKLFVDENKRKSYQERILRFFALRDFLNYKNSMSQQMNEYMSKFQNADSAILLNLKSMFVGTIDIIKQVLGKQAFYSIERETGNTIQEFSPTVYDSIAIAFSYFPKHELMINADKIRNELKKLRTNQEYLENTYAATGSKVRVQGRIKQVYDIISSIVGNKNESRTFDASIKDQLWHDNYVCSWCNNIILSKDDAEIDHIYPYSKGGKTILENAQLLHRHCNKEKLDSINTSQQVNVEDDFDEDEE